MCKQNEKTNIKKKYIYRQIVILELKHTKTELKNSLEEINIRLDQADQSVNSKAVHLKLLSQKYIKKNEQKWKKV